MNGPRGIEESKDPKQQSYIGVWDRIWVGRSSDEQHLLALKASDYLNDDEDIKTVEDWGSGACFLAKYLRPDIEYTPIDAATNIESKFTVNVVDLVDYKSSVDGIFLKHVLEHNYAWEKIFRNFLSSFKRRGVVVIFTPFSGDVDDRVITCTYESQNDKKESVRIPDISLSREKFDNIVKEYPGVSYTEQTIKWDSPYKIENILNFTRA